MATTTRGRRCLLQFSTQQRVHCLQTVGPQELVHCLQTVFLMSLRIAAHVAGNRLPQEPLSKAVHTKLTNLLTFGMPHSQHNAMLRCQMCVKWNLVVLIPKNKPKTSHRTWFVNTLKPGWLEPTSLRMCVCVYIHIYIYIYIYIHVCVHTCICICVSKCVTRRTNHH